MHTSYSLSELVSTLLATAADLRIDDLEIDACTPMITMSLTSTQLTAACPQCQQVAVRIHSRYTRTLADLPWAHIAVRLRLHVRRFFCASSSCRRRIFTERLPTLTAPWARRTLRLTARHRALGFALGGAPAARVATHLDHPASRDTLLRGVRRTPDPEHSTPTVLGVDDWAQRKGRSYGTLLVDLEQRCPLDLLPDRTSTTLAHWLRDHPGVAVITRDRAGAYADGATDGAPAAVQVADRWHLLKNLGEALMRVLDAHPETRTLPAAAQPSSPPLERPAGAPASDASSAPPVLAQAPEPARTMPPSRKEREWSQRQARRQARYAQICALRQHGLSLRAIADQLHLARGTVQKYVHATACPEPRPRTKRPSLLDPYKSYLVDRWNAGCHIGTHLLQEIQEQGYTGGRSIVMDFIAAVRKQQGVAPMRRVRLQHQAACDPTVRPPTPRDLVWLILQRPEQLDETEHTRLVQLRQVNAELDLAVTLAQAFAAIVRDRRHADLDRWLEQAAASPMPALRSFVTGIRRDYAAVRAAVTLPYSNGMVEGHVNRLKYVKRQMYGRAKFDLLRKRVLYAA